MADESVEQWLTQVDLCRVRSVLLPVVTMAVRLQSIPGSEDGLELHARVLQTEHHRCCRRLWLLTCGRIGMCSCRSSGTSQTARHLLLRRSCADCSLEFFSDLVCNGDMSAVGTQILCCQQLFARSWQGSTHVSTKQPGGATAMTSDALVLVPIFQ
jgi:hypothetical protein